MDRKEKQALTGEVGRYQMQVALRDAAEATESPHDLFQRFTNMVQFHLQSFYHHSNSSSNELTFGSSNFTSLSSE